VKSSSSSSGPGWASWKCSSSTSTSWTILGDVDRVDVKIADSFAGRRVYLGWMH
jgi:hypothetical protein